MKTDKYDIIVVGAGLNGLALSCMLPIDLRVLVIDAKAEPSLDIASNYANDARGIALTYSSLETLKQYGVVLDLQYPIKNINVSVHKSIGNIALSATDIDLKSLGAVIPYSELEGALYRQSKKSKIDFLFNSKLESMEYTNADIPSYVLKIDGQQYAAKLVVAADGVNSKIKELMNIKTTTAFGGKLALVCNVKVNLAAKIKQYDALLRFFAGGSIAILPFGHECYKLIIIANRKNIVNITNLKQYIMQFFYGRVFDIELLTEPQIFPIQQSYAKNIVMPGLVLIGNAANNLSPLAAMGFNLGLRDCSSLAALIDKNKEQLYTIKFMSYYLQSRQKDHNTIRFFTEKLNIIMVDMKHVFVKGLLLKFIQTQIFIKSHILEALVFGR